MRPLVQVHSSNVALRFAAAVALSLSVLGGLALLATGHTASVAAPWHALAPADTEQVPVRSDTLLRPDTLALDSLALIDSLARPDTGLVAKYLPRRLRDGYAARLIPRTRNPFSAPLGGYWRQNVVLDSLGRYVAREQVGDADVRLPNVADLDTYRQARLQAGLRTQWRTLADRQAAQQSRQGGGGLGFEVDIPGGRQGAFTTIFGKPSVSLRVNGSANIDGGLNYRTSEQQEAITGDGGQMDPNFKQNISLGITGMIGDKLRVNVNWDTQRQFDFENQLKLEYTGYEDEILQKVEAGNVFLETSSQLINGGQRLFGIRSEFQVGGLRLTAVASQQDGRGSSKSLTGGSEENVVEVLPYEYEAETHFFIGYHFRNYYEVAQADPLLPQVPPGFSEIAELEVWRFDATLAKLADEDESVRSVVALADLGEELEVVKERGTLYRGTNRLPNPDRDRYTEADLQAFAGGQDPESYFEANGMEKVDAMKGPFRLLKEGSDYEYDNRLGYLTLQSRLSAGQALAVAYSYVDNNGRVVTVGELSGRSGGSDGSRSANMVLKLVRAPNLLPQSDTWPLMLRNIYRVNAGGTLKAADFEFDIFYETSSYPRDQQPNGVRFSGNRTLLQVLGLDRIDEQGAKNPDNRIDFTGRIVDAGRGRIIFPYLEPFVDRLRQALNENGTQFTSVTKEEALARYVLEKPGEGSLYNMKPTEAQQIGEFKVYTMAAEQSSAVQSRFTLGFNLVEGSVRVRANGAELQPGTDYSVDYAAGQLNILNRAYLAPGTDLQVTFEENQFLTVQRKTLLGLRVDYTFGDALELGGTFMRLAERPQADKFRLGQEPITNMIWGFDGSFDTEPRWLTRAVDWLPFIETAAPSQIRVSGEFAQLLPGHAEARAFERQRGQLQNLGLDFKPDELEGLTFVDDFEGIENSLSLMQPNAWKLPSAPLSAPGALDGVGTTEAQAARNDRRAAFGWYTVPRNLQTNNDLPDATRLVRIQDVFADREVENQREAIPTFDFYFDPGERGPYNYTRQLDDFTQPSTKQQMWGGMIQRILDSYNDFSEKNIEFVEFIFTPFAHGSSGQLSDDARLYVELGEISEDVLPNGKLNTEDGLSLTANGADEFDQFGRYSDSGVIDGVVRVENGRTEDVGLDGLISYPDALSLYEPELTEQGRFADYVAGLTGVSPEAQALLRRAQRDPSGDDYHDYLDPYFEDPAFFPNAVRLQHRFLHYNPGTELNTFEAQNKIVGIDGVNGNVPSEPSSEDLNLNEVVDRGNAYYQYEIPLKPTELAKSPYFVNRLEGKSGLNWYFVRIPVKDFTAKFGDIEGFNLVENMRIWTTGHDAPVTVRFASLDLVGSQWEKSEEIFCSDPNALENCAPNPATSFSISTINNEENPGYNIPNGAVVSEIRTQSGMTITGREQSMVLTAERLDDGRARAVTKALPRGEDFLRYSNLRMFVHLDGKRNGAADITERGDIELFLRFGTNTTTDYYEYAQPLTPSPPGATTSDDLWQTNQMLESGDVVDLNSVNIELSALNQLKVARDLANAPIDKLVYGTALDGAPDPESFAPPGTRLGIRGNPSLSGVAMLVIGLRNVSGETLQEVNVWVNELRVSGYDETPGWAALGNATIKLADVANVTANFRTETDGFGALDSGLGDRGQNDQLNWALNTSFNVHKLLPQRYGWSIPVNYSVRSNTTTPRYDPSLGDIRLDEITGQIKDNESLTPEVRAARVDSVMDAARTQSFSQSVSVPISKSGSRSALLRNTLDAVQVSYNWSESTQQNPSVEYEDQWQWATNVSYSLRLGQPKTLRPFWFIDGLPYIGGLGKLRFNYVPQSVTASAGLNRNSQERKARVRNPDPLLPDVLQSPLRVNHTFGHERRGGLQWNPFSFLTLGYNSTTSQSLKNAGEERDRFYVLYDSTGQVIQRLDASAVDADTLSGAFGELEEVEITPFGDVVGSLLRGTVAARTNSFNQTFTGTLQPRLNTVSFLDWITFKSVNYNGAFTWTNGPVVQEGEEPLGAGVSNSLGINTGIELKPRVVWRKFGFYTAWEEAQATARRTKQTERTRREQEQKQLREARTAARSARTALDSLATAGIDLEAPPDSVATDVARWQAAIAAEASLQARLDTTDTGGFKLPSVGGVLRTTFLALTGLESVSVDYRHSRSAAASNVAGGYETWNAFSGSAPSLAFRLGLRDRIDFEDRVDNSAVQISDNFRTDHLIDAATRFQVGQDLSVSLSWNTGWNDSESLTYARGSADPTRNFSGAAQASAVGLTGSYEAFFDRQYDRLSDESGTPLTSESVRADFTSTFVRGPGSVGVHGFLAFPMPSWNVSYSGIGKLPLVRAVAQSATLSHVYNGVYDTSFRYNIDADTTAAFTLADRTVTYTVPEFEAQALTLNQGFSPLIGLNVQWKGGVQTNFRWNHSKERSLSGGTFELGESTRNELQFTGSYRVRGLELALPFLGGRKINNDLAFSLSVARSYDENLRYVLRRDLELKRNGTAEQNAEFQAPQVRSNTRLSIQPSIDYTFSNRVTGTFYVEYEKRDSEGTLASGTSNFNGGFRLRVNFSQ